MKRPTEDKRETPVTEKKNGKGKRRSRYETFVANGGWAAVVIVGLGITFVVTRFTSC